MKQIKKPHLLEEKKDGQFQKPDMVILINLIITDNEERTIENTLLRLGYKDIALKRQIYLGFYFEGSRSEETVKILAEKLIRSGEILNINKEIPTIFINYKTYLFDTQKGLIDNNNTIFSDSCYLAQEYDNYTGKSIQNRLVNHDGFDSIIKIERGVFWSIKTKNGAKVEKIIKRHIFHNPHSMKLVSLS